MLGYNELPVEDIKASRLELPEFLTMTDFEPRGFDGVHHH
jgi:hypothetical protein